MDLSAGENREKVTNTALIRRSLVLFANFFLIILAYYQVKAASRSLLIEFGGAAWFPYTWIISAVVLLGLVGFYHRIVARHSRARVVLGSLCVFAGLLVLFRGVLDREDTVSAVAFYVFVDIFSVILVEQFWSLTNTVNDAQQGRRTYWFVGTGGIVGGIVGGVAASWLVVNTPLVTADLLYVCAALLVVTAALNYGMLRRGFYREIGAQSSHEARASDWRVLISDRYLLLIATLLCLSQLAQPVVEFQFISAVESVYTDLDARTAFIGEFFSLMGLVSVAVNLLLTPLIHRHLGLFAGLTIQPLMLTLCSFGFYLQASLNAAVAMKISDRGLSYSINRASKELLYIPVDPVVTYQAKAWIDMLGYRLFKVLGSGLILLATEWLPVRLDVAELSILTWIICTLWIITIAVLATTYRRLVPST